MKNNSKPNRLRLSPNELQTLVKEERDKWRIFRIQQVREQAREEAQRVREAVRTKEEKMIELLSREVTQQWEAEKENKVSQLERQYQDCMRNIGQAHRQATQQPDPHKVLQQQAQHDRRLAVLRGQEAGKQQQEEVKQQQHERNTLLKQRQEALRLERLRARHVANLPLPEVFRKKTVIEEKPQQRVALHEAGTFTTTHYVPKNIKIEKEVWSSKPNAKEVAAAEEAKRERLEKEKRKQAEEDQLRREQRGKDALRKEQLTRLLQHLMEGLDEAQRQQHLSQFMNGKEGSVMETKESFLKEQNRQQREVEEAVEKLLQEKMEEEKEEEEEIPSTDSNQLSSEYLEEVESSVGGGQEATTGTKVRGLKSLLEEVERRRRRILQEMEDSVPVRGPTDPPTGDDEGDGSGPADTARSIHLADTVPVHLHPGHPHTRGPPNASAAGQPPLLSPLSEGSTTELPDSSSTVLPLSEESIPLSTDLTQPSTTPSPSHRYSTPAQPRDTYIKHPNLAKPHTTPSDASSSSSGDIKINVDLDVGSSSLIGSDSTLDQNQQSESPISSTEYYSPPSELPRRPLSLQEIEDNLKRIQENRQHNWNLLNHLSWRRGLPGSLTPITTYMEKLKEEGTGKKPIKKKEKFEHQKRELIQYYIQRLLQRGEHEGELSASTVEGSGLSISSLGSLLSYLEGEREKDQPTDLPSSSASATLSSTTSRSLSDYKDIDEFPVRMRSRERVHPPSHITHVTTTTPYTTTSSVTPTTTLLSCSSSTLSSSFSPEFQHYLSSTYPSRRISKPHIHPHDSVSTARQKLSGHDFVSPTNGSSTSGSPEQVSTEGEGSQRHSSPCSYLTPISEDEPAVREYEAASELDTTTTRRDERMKKYRTQTSRLRQYHPADITTSSSGSPKEITSKLPKISREYRMRDLSLTDTTETIPPVATHTYEDTERETTSNLITSSEIKMSDFRHPETSKSKLSELPGTDLSTFQSFEGGESPYLPPTTSVPSVTTPTTVSTPATPPFSQPVSHSHSSEESSASMPDMSEVLRRFGLERATVKSSSTTTNSEEENSRCDWQKGME